MAWTSLAFAFESVLSSAKMTQMQANFLAMANGDAGAPSIADGALSSNVCLKSIGNVFLSSQTIQAPGAILFIDDLSNTPTVRFRASGVTSAMVGTVAPHRLSFFSGNAQQMVAWDLSTNPGTLVTGSIPDARLTSNVTLLNTVNTFSENQRINAGLGINVAPPGLGDFAISGSMIGGIVPLARVDGSEKSVGASFGVIGAHSTRSFDLTTFTGLTVEDYVLVSTNTVVPDWLILSGQVLNATTVRMHLHNVGTIGLFAPVGTYRARVFKR